MGRGGEKSPFRVMFTRSSDSALRRSRVVSRGDQFLGAAEVDLQGSRERCRLDVDMRRLVASDGQSVLAVVLVVVAFGGLVAAAVPTYLGFQDRRAKKAAESHLLAAVWTAEAYRQDHGSYAGMDTVDLLNFDPRIPRTLAVVSAQRRSYCLTDSVSGRSWSISGPYRGDATFKANASCS
jgi:Tfp pilus assembly protein PilE